MNEAGNEAGSVTVGLPKRAKRRRDAPLSTNQMVEMFRSALLVKRSDLGANTPEGHRCSNIDEMLQNRETATGDQLANLNRDIATQVAALAALTVSKGDRA